MAEEDWISQSGQDSQISQSSHVYTVLEYGKSPLRLIQSEYAYTTEQAAINAAVRKAKWHVPNIASTASLTELIDKNSRLLEYMDSTDYHTSRNKQRLTDELQQAVAQREDYRNSQLNIYYQPTKQQLKVGLQISIEVRDPIFAIQIYGSDIVYLVVYFRLSH